MFTLILVHDAREDGDLPAWGIDNQLAER